MQSKVFHFCRQMVEQVLISDLATIVEHYSQEMWLFTADETRNLYHSQSEALQYACEWMYKKTNDILGNDLFELNLFNQQYHDYFVVGRDGGIDYVIRLKETLQNDYDNLCCIYEKFGVERYVVEQLHYCTK